MRNLSSRSFSKMQTFLKGTSTITFKSGILSTHSRLASTSITLFCHCQSLYDLIHRSLRRHCIHGLCIWPAHQLASWDLSGAQRSRFSDAWRCCPNGEYWLVPRKQPPALGTQTFSSQTPGSWREGVCFPESLGNNACDTDLNCGEALRLWRIASAG